MLPIHNFLYKWGPSPPHGEDHGNYMVIPQRKLILLNEHGMLLENGYTMEKLNLYLLRNKPTHCTLTWIGDDLCIRRGL